MPLGAEVYREALRDSRSCKLLCRSSMLRLILAKRRTLATTVPHQFFTSEDLSPRKQVYAGITQVSRQVRPPAVLYS